LSHVEVLIKSLELNEEANKQSNIDKHPNSLYGDISYYIKNWQKAHKYNEIAVLKCTAVAAGICAPISLTKTNHIGKLLVTQSAIAQHIMSRDN